MKKKYIKSYLTHFADNKDYLRDKYELGILQSKSETDTWLKNHVNMVLNLIAVC
jgi:hypothetical protein